MPESPWTRARRPRRAAHWRALIALLLALLLVSGHATAEPRPPQMAAAELRPALIVVPASDGQSVLVQAGGVGQLGGQVFTNLRIGPTGNKGSYTMAYSSTIESYVATLPGFTSGTVASASLSITTTQGLDSGEVVFDRSFIPANQLGIVLNSSDGGLQVELINPGSFSGDAYLAATPSIAPPGPAPSGYRMVGRSYSLRDSGAFGLADKNLIVRLGYAPGALSPSERAGLAIFAWDAAPTARRWDRLGGTIAAAPESYVSVATRRLTFFALMVPVAQPPPPEKEHVYLPLLRAP